MKKGLIISLLFPLLFSCGDIENCDADRNQDYIIVRFFDKDTKASKKVGFTFTAENSPNRFLFDADTTISARGETIIDSDSTVIGLPLNPNDLITTFYFDSDSSSHELVLSYTKELTIFHPKCNPSLTFTNLDTVSQTFDSTVVVNAFTNKLIRTNIEIYF